MTANRPISSRSILVAENIRDRVTFRTYGALCATVTNGLTAWDSGRLAGTDLERFMVDRPTIDYVVYSYATPIAWHAADGWHRVAQKFSMTTSHHQGRLYLIP